MSTTRSQRQLWLILTVAILPIAAAYFVFFTGFGLPSKTVNAGSFIEPPTSLEGLVSKKTWENIQSDKKWRLLVPLMEPCDEPCAQNLYTSRQVHIRLDQKSNRLQRIAIATPSLSATMVETLKNEHPRMALDRIGFQAWLNWLDSLAIPEIGGHYYFLIDQEGRAIMYYTSDTHGNEVLKDIKRAIKFSIDYQ